MITNTMSSESIKPSRFSLFFPTFLVLLAVVLLQGTVWTSDVFAQGLRIVDCQGKTRATKELASAEPTDIEVALQSAQIGTIKLVNSDGTVLVGEVSENVAKFHAVPPGIWVLTSDTPTFFSAISFEPLKGFWLSTTGEVVAATAAVVGGVLIGTQFKGNGSGRGSDGGGNGSTGGGTCAMCNPDSDAPSIVPFSRRH